MVKAAKATRKKEEVEELKEQLARALADYDNLRKRVEREREEFVRHASVSFFKKLLPVFDMLNQARKHLNDEGLENIFRELKKVLQLEGIEEIEVNERDNFDEKIHEAVDVDLTEDKNKIGKISQIVLPGWRVKDGMVIRPAKVKVYSENIREKEKIEKELSRGEYV